MASVPQSSWFCALSSINNGSLFLTKPNHKNCTFKTLKAPSCSSDADSSPEVGEMDPVRLAFSRAKAYKKSVQPNSIPKIVPNPLLKDPQLENGNDSSVSEDVKDGGNDEVPLSVKIAMEKAKKYKKNKEIVSSSSGIAKKSELVSDTKNDGSMSDVTNGGNQEVPTSVKLAMEKAREYKKNKGADKGADGGQLITGLKGGSGTIPENMLSEQISGKMKELTISSLDFVGLDFAEKKSSRGLPPGLLPVTDTFLGEDTPDVEILVGDTSKFGNATTSKPESTEEDKSDMYKPKVSTWGVFPRPSNISRTYGGGRNIRPGDMLETAEEKAAKQERTRELLAAYRRKVGLSIDPQLKVECEKALKDGDSLMDLGKLSEALPFYEKIMDKLTFQSELHGLAALQWSICQDSLSRPNEARAMYEKLQSHPNIGVSKKAKQFLFSFQAMEMMKIKNTNKSTMNTGYQNYFEAFIEDKANCSVNDAEVEVGALSQALPYMIFLVSPVFIVLLIAIQKGV